MAAAAAHNTRSRSSSKRSGQSRSSPNMEQNLSLGKRSRNGQGMTNLSKKPNTTASVRKGLSSALFSIITSGEVVLAVYYVEPAINLV